MKRNLARGCRWVFALACALSPAMDGLCSDQQSSPPAGTILFSDDFEDGALDGWTGNYSIVDDDGNKVLKSTNSSVFAGSRAWKNYSYEGRIKTLRDDYWGGPTFLMQDGLNWYSFHFKSPEKNGRDRNDAFTIGVGASQTGKLISTPYRCPLRPGIWHKFRIVVHEHHFKAYLDDKYVGFGSHTDFTQGGIGFAAKGGGTIYLDDLVVRSIDRVPDPIIHGPAADYTDNDHRKHVLLNGLWDVTPAGGTQRKIRVPGIYGVGNTLTGCEDARYRTEFRAPADPRDVVRLLFNSVTDFCEISLNGAPVAKHRGGQVGFAVDVTDRVRGGATNTLEMRVWSDTSEGGLRSFWPHGWVNNQDIGISGDVWLVSCPRVYVDDVFVKPSVRGNRIAFEVTVVNRDDKQHVVDIETAAYHDGDVQKAFAPEKGVTVPAAGSVKATITREWTDAHKWWPDDPYLYALKTVLNENGRVVDERGDDRFGFRELWVDGTRLRLNGEPYVLRGDSIVEHGVSCSGTKFSTNATMLEYYATKAEAKKIIHAWKSGNLTVVRSHMGPFPKAFLDACDEEGFLVILESNIYGSHQGNVSCPPATDPDGRTLFENIETWIKQCVRTYKNHPSIVVWSAGNEGGYCRGGDTFCQWFKAAADTRLVSYDEPTYRHSDINNMHYDYNIADERLYDIPLIRPGDKPSAQGEFGWFGGANDFDNGLVTRGYRYSGYVDVRPYRMNNVFNERNKGFREYEQEFRVIRNGMAAVAVWDKEYDKLGKQPKRPELVGGTSIARNLIVVNDDRLDGDQVLVEWVAKIDGRTVDSGSFRVTLANGSKTERQITVRVPRVSENKEMLLELKASKNGVEKYLDDFWYRFVVRPGG